VLGPQEHPEEQHVDQRVELGHLDVQDRGVRARQARVVADDVQAAEGVHSCRHRARHVLLLADIGAHEDNAIAKHLYEVVP